MRVAARAPNANVSGESLTIDTGTNLVTNIGTFEASNGGTFDILSDVDKIPMVRFWCSSVV